MSKLLTVLELWVPHLRNGFITSALPTLQDPDVRFKPIKIMHGEGSVESVCICLCVSKTPAFVLYLSCRWPELK